MYDPGPVPTDIKELVSYLGNEIEKLKLAINYKDFIPLSIRHVAPGKPQVGLYAADGTDWDPGSGAGVYFYNGSSYVALHT